MDGRAVLAREHHTSATEAEELAAEYRSRRDRLIRELYADGFGYGTLARMLGCSKALIRQVVNRRDTDD
jgi:hypothetical protein